MVLMPDDSENLGWYVIHTTCKIDDISQLRALLSIIENTAPWIVSNVSVSWRGLDGWSEVDEYL